MDRLKVLLLGIIIVLLVVLVVDRSRQIEQQSALNATTERLALAVDRLAGGQRRAPNDSDQPVAAAEAERLARLAERLDRLAERPTVVVNNHGMAPAPAAAVVSAPPIEPTSPAVTTEPAADQADDAALADDHQPAPTSAEPDGKPRLGRNFLLPYDGSHFRPERLGGTLTSFNSTPDTINPILASSATAQDIEDLVNDTLVSTHPADPFSYRQNLATSCVISDDYTTYTFTLRRGVFWQIPNLAREPGFAWLAEPVEMTAHDVVFYVDMILDEDVITPHLKAYYEDLEGAEALDDFTLRLRWKRKVHTSLDFSFGLRPLPRHVYGRNADGSAIAAEQVGAAFNRHWFDEERQAIGVGRYQVASYTPDQELVFRRNPDYWGATLNFERLVWNLAIKDDEARLVAYKNGQVQAYGLSPTQYRSQILDRGDSRFAAPVEDDPKAGRAGPLAWEKVQVRAYDYVGWNLRSRLFADVRVRQAMGHAFPRQRLIDDVFQGLGRPCHSNVHDLLPYHDPTVPRFEYDPEQAARLLDEAGWTDSDGDGWRDQQIDGERVRFAFILKHYANSPEWESLGLIYRDELRKVGIDMTPRAYEWKELLRIYQDFDFDAVGGAWRMPLSVDFYQLWHSKYADEPGSSNLCGFKDPRADEIAEALRQEFDFDERVRLAKEFQQILTAAAPYTFFRVRQGVFTWRNGEREPEGLLGVAHDLDAFHPLLSREEQLNWYFAPAGR